MVGFEATDRLPPGDPEVVTDEPTLVRRASAGCEESFAALHDVYARPLFHFLAARLPDRQDAEDALQATLLSAWAALPRLRRPEAFAGWLFRIARNEARDAGRRRGLRPVLLREEDGAAAPSSGPAGDERVRTLVERLKPTTRTIVLLRAVEDWSTERIAAALRLGASTVRRRYAAAIRHLRRSLERGERS